MQIKPLPAESKNPRFDIDLVSRTLWKQALVLESGRPELKSQCYNLLAVYVAWGNLLNLS